MQNSNSDHKYTDVLATQQQNSGKSFKYYFSSDLEHVDCQINDICSNQNKCKVYFE